MSRTWKLAAGVAALAAVALTVVLIATREPSRPAMPYVYLTYEVAPLDGQTEEQAVDQAIAGIRARIDTREVPYASVFRDSRSPSHIRVELGGKDVPFDRMIEIIQRSAVLGIHHVVENDGAMRLMVEAARAASPDGITAETDAWQGPDGDHHADVFLASEDRLRLEAFTRTSGFSVEAGRRIAYEMMDAPDATTKPRWRTYVLEAAPILDGANVAKAEVSFDQVSLRPLVLLELDAVGRDAFAMATQRALGRKLAIVLDGQVQSAPVVQSAITAGRIHVTMGGSDPKAAEREAHDLVAVLRAGTIPPLRLVERRDVGPAR